MTQTRSVTLIAPRTSIFFFFQAEDGIRDDLVTGVQTCALPIWLPCCAHGPLARADPANTVPRRGSARARDRAMPPSHPGQIVLACKRAWRDARAIDARSGPLFGLP